MSDRAPEGVPSADREWVLEAVPRVSRTFALSIELLEEPMASWVATGYLLCRTADTVEDEPTIPPRKRAALLDTYEAVLDPEADTDVETFLEDVEAVAPADGGDDWAVLAHTDRTLRVLESFDAPVQNAMRSVTREMATGMADILRRHADDGGLRLGSVDELEEYCWYVAGTVGKLFTGLRECRDGETGTQPDPADARSFALLLQLVNVAKDVRADWEEENNVYLPEEWLAEEGVDAEAVADPENAEAVARVVRQVVDHAGDHAGGARRYLATIPEDSGLLEASALPYLLALGTMRELRGHTLAAVEQVDAVKLDRSEVEALCATMERGISQDDVDDIAATIKDEPYGI